MSSLAYSELEKIFQSYYLLRRNLSILNWDSAVVMPKASGEIRARQLSAQTQIIHKTLAASNVSKLMNQTEDDVPLLSDWQKSNFREMKRIHFLSNALPMGLQSDLSQQGVKCELDWREAKKNNDFSLFSKSFSKVLDLVKKKADLLANAFGSTPYCGLMQEYDPSAGQDNLNTLFASLSERLPSVIQDICKKQTLDNPKNYSLPKIEISIQKKICRKILVDLGFDFNRGRLDESAHPFTEGGVGDIRITTRYQKNDFQTALLSAIHECGHALYDSHLPENWYMQPVGYDRGMVIHEGIALFYEMMVAGSKSFSTYLSRILFDFGISCEPETIFNSFNRVRPGPIRIEADEVTYIPHIILRYEIETMLLEEKIKIKELPDYWNERMFDLLDLKPSPLQENCLQDAHWSLGLLGYFPSYAKGLLIAVQMEQDYLSPNEGLDFKKLLQSLNRDIFSQASFYQNLPKTENLFSASNSTQNLLNYFSKKYLRGD